MDLNIKRLIHVRQAHSPEPMPNGDVLYVSDVTGVPQIWFARRGRHDMLIPFEERMASPLASPSGVVAFASDTGGDERWHIYLFNGRELERIADEGMNLLGAWSPDGRFLAYTSNRRNDVDFDLYVYDVYTGKTTKVAELDGHNAPHAWMGNGVLVTHMNSNLDTDIYLVTLDGTQRNVTKHEGEAINMSPIPIDGEHIFFLSNVDSEYVGLARLNVATGESKYHLSLDMDVESFALSHDGRHILYSVNNEGFSELYLTNVNATLHHKVASEPGVVRELKWKFGIAVLTHSGPRTGTEVWAYDVSRGMYRLTDSPKMGISMDDMVVPEVYRYESHDGLLVPVLMYKPRSPPPYRAVIYLHGGPEAQERPEFKPLVQLLVASGYLVAAPNYRGSTGYGKTYVHLDDVERRWGAIMDVVHLAKWLRATGMALDMCLMGGSYGGYLTLMAMATEPSEWRCGVEMVGIVNLVTFLENTSKWRRRYREAEYGSLEAHRSVLEDLSPINHADRIAAPLMVIHGERDPRVPINEAEQLVERLRGMGRHVVYIRLQDEGHGISKIHNRARVYTEILKFLAENLG